MREIFERVIRAGGYDLVEMLGRIDEYHVTGRLTDEDREALVALARSVAAPQLDLAAEVQRLWEANRALTARVTALEGSAADGGDEGSGDAAPAWVQPTGAHDAYFAGARVAYKGRIWVCVAPEGMACVWSPDVMPDYWEAEGDA